MKRDLARRVAAVAVLVVAGVATIATSQAVPMARTETTFAVSLSPDHPIDIRRISIALRNSGHTPSEVSLGVTPDEFPENPGFRLSLVADDPLETPPDPLGHRSSEWASASVSITDICRTDCERTYTLVSRLVDPAGAPISEEVTARLVAEYEGAGLETPLGAVAELNVGPDDAATRGLATLRDSLTGELTVGVDQLQAGWAGQLRVPAATLPGLNEARAIGVVWLSVEASPIADRGRVDLTTKVGGTYELDSLLETEYQRDVEAAEWISSCVPGTDCIVPLALQAAWNPWPDNSGSVPSTGSVTLAWTLEATIEYLDRTAPPAGATLELVATQ